jgi:hypothetical protein
MITAANVTTLDSFIHYRLLGEPVPIMPDPAFEIGSTVYSFNRGEARFEVSARDLAESLEESVNRDLRRFPWAMGRLEFLKIMKSGERRTEDCALGSTTEQAAVLAVKLRFAIVSHSGALDESELPIFAFQGERQSFVLFSRGRFRIVRGAEAGSRLVLLNWECAIGGRLAHGGEAICWSGSEKSVLSRVTWKC